MIILSQKAFGSIMDQDEEWKQNTAAELERNKERDKKLKKLPLHDRIAAGVMWEDTHAAGTERYIRNQAVSGLVGAGIGMAAGHFGNKALKANHGRIARVGGAIVGHDIARTITHKKNRRIEESIWDKGDKEQMDYINADKKTKKKIEKDYKPIGWRVDRKGEYLPKDAEYPFYGPSLQDKVGVREAYVNKKEKHKKK